MEQEASELEKVEEGYKDYEVAKRSVARGKPPTTFLGILWKKIFPQSEVVEVIVIRTLKTRKEVCRYYGGSDYVDFVRECTRTVSQQLEII
ncbi:hypothetical protein KAJ41_01355 [Candidatus Parcubacteria bacterium]|nr:hypothetical protein [Candidatus Parcubacteria bacterium]